MSGEPKFTAWCVEARWREPGREFGKWQEASTPNADFYAAMRHYEIIKTALRAKDQSDCILALVMTFLRTLAPEIEFQIRLVRVTRQIEEVIDAPELIAAFKR